MESQGARPSGFRDKYGPLLYDNIPYKGDSFLYKDDDSEAKRPVFCSKVHIKRLDTSDPADMDEWESITQSVMDGVSTISFEEKQYVPETGHWVVLVRWLEHYYTAPDNMEAPDIKEKNQTENI